MKPQKLDSIKLVFKESQALVWHYHCAKSLAEDLRIPLRILVQPPDSDHHSIVDWMFRTVTKWFGNAKHLRTKTLSDFNRIASSVDRFVTDEKNPGSSKTILWIDLSPGPPDRDLLGSDDDVLWWFSPLPDYHSIGFREMVQGRKGLQVSLMETTLRTEDRCLRHARLKNVKYSLSRQIDNYLQTLVDWPADVLRNYTNYRNRTSSRRKSPVSPDPDSTSFLELMQFFHGLLWKKYERLFEKFFLRDVWNIGLLDTTIEETLSPKFEENSVQWCPETDSTSYRADPFALRHKNRTTVFYEKFSHSTNQGKIVYSENLFDGGAINETTVFDNNHHQSYPYLLKHKNTAHLVVEEADTNQVNLYRALDFPDRWTKKATLLENFPALDPTLYRYNNRWWLMASSRNDRGNYALYVWFSEELSGRYEPHQVQPVKQDLLSSRPAGTPFQQNGTLYRPSQDCSDGYGARITLNEVKELTPETFSETTVKTLSPRKNGPYPEGFHTLSKLGSQTLVDGKRIEFTVPNPLSWNTASETTSNN